MKNSIITIMLFVLFATSLTACDLQKDPALIALPTETSGEVYSEETDRATAYISIINGLISRYGEGRIVKNSYDDGESMIGVAIVRLIDFDGDGKYELYCAYADEDAYWVNKHVIYGYDKGLIELLKEHRISNPGTDVSPSTTFLSKNGKVYLVDIYEITDGNYFTVQDGEIDSALNYYYDFFEDENFTLNEADATKEDVLAAIEEMEKDGTKEVISFVYDVDSAELIKTKETIADITTLAQIESLEGYIVIEGNVLHLNEVEVIMPDDKERMEKLKLTEQDMPNGYYLFSLDIEKTYELSDETTYTFVDFNLLFIDSEDGSRLYTTTIKDEFVKHLSTSYSDSPPAQNVTFFIQVKDGKVISVSERFEFTI